MSNTSKAIGVAVAIGLATLTTFSGPSGQNQVFTAGIASGYGTIAHPVEMPIAVDGTTVLGTGSAGDKLRLNAAVTQLDLALFGDGSQGNVTISASTTLTGNVYAEDFTIDPGVVVDSGAYQVWVHGTFTCNGTLHRNGGNGATGNGRSNSVGGCSQATGGVGRNGNGSLPQGQGNPGCSGSASTASPFPSAAGVAGGVVPAVNTVGSNGANATIAGSSGGGGTGGAANTTLPSAGCTSGVMTRQTAANGNVGDTRIAMTGRTKAGTLFSISSGGGGGSCGTNITGNVPAGGGGGGGAGGWLVVFAHKMAGTGCVISANGGNGGAGGGGTATSSGGGGGGAGAGGFVLFVIGGGAFPTVTANPGSVGLGSAGTGTTGGQPNRNGGNGGTAMAGYVFTARAGF